MDSDGKQCCELCCVQASPLSGLASDPRENTCSTRERSPGVAFSLCIVRIWGADLHFGGGFSAVGVCNAESLQIFCMGRTAKTTRETTSTIKVFLVWSLPFISKSLHNLIFQAIKMFM